MYDTVWIKNKAGEDVDLQFKNGECILTNYEIGDTIEISDGIYYTHDGVFVIYRGVVVAGFAKEDEQIFDKWEGKIPYPELS